MKEGREKKSIDGSKLLLSLVSYLARGGPYLTMLKSNELMYKMRAQSMGRCENQMSYCKACEKTGI